MSFSYIHFAANVEISMNAIPLHCIFHILCNSSDDWHLGWFHVLTVENSAAINMVGHYLLESAGSYLLGIYPVVRQTIPCIVLKDPHNVFHSGWIYLKSQQQGVRLSPSPHHLQQPFWQRWLDISLWHWFQHSWWLVISSLFSWIGHFYFFFRELSLQVFSHFFTGLGFLLLLLLFLKYWYSGN